MRKTTTAITANTTATTKRLTIGGCEMKAARDEDKFAGPSGRSSVDGAYWTKR